MAKTGAIKEKLMFLKTIILKKQGLQYFASLSLFAASCIFDKGSARIEALCICTCTRVFSNFYYFFSENLDLNYIAIPALLYYIVYYSKLIQRR